MTACAHAKSGDTATTADSIAATVEPTDAATENVSFEFLEGTWQLYDANRGNKNITLTLDVDGSIILWQHNRLPNIPGTEVLDFEPLVSYEGTYSLQGNDLNYSMTTTNFDAEGTLRLARSGNFLLATLSDDIINIANKGTTLKFFNVDEAYPAQLGERPSVVDILKAVRPFVFDDVVRDATTLIVDSRQPAPDLEATQTTDNANGYISYTSGGAPASGMEACIWRCNDGSTLFALNVLGEGVDVRPTTYFRLFAYYPEAKCIRGLTRESEDLFMAHPRYSGCLQLPRHGKDIKICIYRPDGTIETTETRKWNGNGFK